MEKLKLFIKQLKTGENPGPDSVSVAYYKTFAGELSTPCLAAFNFLATHPHSLQNTLEVQISVIPNEGKDATLDSN